MPKRDIVVVGCSSGGLEALKMLVTSLKQDLPGSVMIVQHVLPDARPLLPEILANFGILPCELAEDDTTFQKGHIYVAAPDRHLVIEGEKLRLTRTARENRTRPAVDALFRSAAAEHGNRVIGVVLTGNLDDGAAGLKAVQDAGGVAIVQTPSDAAYPGMPETALEFLKPDHVVPLVQIGALINELVGTETTCENHLSNNVRREAEMEIEENSDAEAVEEIGTLVPVTCPDCGGPLWEMENQPVPRFRCHTGHAFRAESLVPGFSAVTERSLWTALRVMDEKTRMLERLAEDHQKRGHVGPAKAFSERADEARQHAFEIRRLLTDAHPTRRSA